MSLIIAMFACQWNPTEEGLGDVTPLMGIPATQEVETARASLRSADGRVTGQVDFEPVAGGLRVAGAFAGLEPGAVHAVHVHEGARCGEPGYERAGGHFDPTSDPHGHPEAAASHAGDLGNITADADGVAMLDLTREGLDLEGPGNVVARTIVLHADADDFTSQPGGDAGDRLACGEIDPGERRVPVEP